MKLDFVIKLKPLWGGGGGGREGGPLFLEDQSFVGVLRLTDDKPLRGSKNVDAHCTLSFVTN